MTADASIGRAQLGATGIRPDDGSEFDIAVAALCSRASLGSLLIADAQSELALRASIVGEPKRRRPASIIRSAIRRELALFEGLLHTLGYAAHVAVPTTQPVEVAPRSGHSGPARPGHIGRLH